MTKGPLTPIRFGVVDVETTGLRADRHRILQIGAVIVDVDLVSFEARIVETWSTEIKLKWPLQRVGPRHVHGLTRRRLWGAPSMQRALTDLNSRLSGAVLTAHNAAFDAAFLGAAASRAQVDLRPGPALCTLKMSRQLDPERKLSHRLADVCQRCGIINDRPHDALHDALATAAVLPHLLSQHHVSVLEDLQPFMSTPPMPASR